MAEPPPQHARISTVMATGVAEEDRTMKFDDILSEIGEFGRYQKIQYALICLVGIVSAFHAMNMVFLGAKPDYRCEIAKESLPSRGILANMTESEITEALIPDDTRCQMYSVNETEDLLADHIANNSMQFWSQNGSDFSANRTLVDCPHGWVYSKDVYSSTIVSSFDLVCTNDWIRSTSKSLYFVGRLLGAVIFGHLSDRFGRRPCFFVALAMQTISGIILTVSPNIVVFLIFYVFQGIAQVGVFLVAFTIGNELVAPRYRFITGMGIHMFYSVGYMLLAGIAYGINEWRMLELAITLPGLLFVTYWWFLPESARWLLSQRRVDEAIVVLKKVAATNKTLLKEEVLAKVKGENIDKTGASSHTAFDLLRTATTAFISINVWLAWMVNAMVYYGLSLNTNNLGGSPYLNFCIAGAVEIPAFILCILILDRIGRKVPLVIFMLIGGVTCIASGFMPEHLQIAAIVLAMIGKFAISASYVIIYLIGAEVFPTTLRNAGLGIASMCARIGGIICPQILELNTFYSPLPLLVFGVAALGSGMLCLFLPETAGRPMPQTLEEMSRIFRSRFTCRAKSSHNGVLKNNDDTETNI